jgi:hypothetical protein
MENKPRIKRISCFKCRFYLVTWDPRQPYGCRAHGFKTNKNPSVVVFETSGIECQLYDPKKPAD